MSRRTHVRRSSHRPRRADEDADADPARQSPTNPFDRAFIDMMITNHRGAIRMAYAKRLLTIRDVV
jgi:uncharacterized protein (DUF305 family)